MSRDYDQKNLRLALDEVSSGALSLNKASQKYKIPLTTLRRRKKMGEKGKVLRIKPGTKPALGDLEKELAVAVNEFATRGFGLSRAEVSLHKHECPVLNDDFFTDKFYLFACRL